MSKTMTEDAIAHDRAAHSGMAHWFRVRLSETRVARSARWAWLGTCLQASGAGHLAFRTVTPTTAYSIMLGGALIWLGVAAYRRDRAQLALQLVFVVLNVVGIVRWGN